jgi:hypothetical protein
MFKFWKDCWEHDPAKAQQARIAAHYSEMERHILLFLSHNLGLLAYTEADKRLKREENRQESVVLVAQAKGLGGTR